MSSQQNYPTVRNIASNLVEHDPIQARIHAKMLEEVKGFAEAWNEEVAAQTHYNSHKRQSDPVYYEAKYRLFTARWVVKAYLDDEATTYSLRRMVEEELKQEASAKFGSPAEEFKDWLVKETQLYFTALKHPELVLHLCSPDPEVYTRRYAILSQALRKCLAEGADAAYALWKDELRERFESVHGEDTSSFQPFEGGGYGKKDGYWVPGVTAMRPIITNDPAEIQRNRESIAREAVHKARAKRFDHEIQMPTVDEAPKKVGRPKGAKNKPKRYARPVSPDVAQWQAEADAKLGYTPS